MTDLALERDAIALFEAMLDIAEGERDVWLAGQAGERPELLARVEAMRAADREVSLRTGGAAGDMGEDAEPPERLGAYRLGELIGRGGMGSVYLARRDRGDFSHVAAIKIIKPGLLSSALVERFRRERQTLARLSHPNIAQLLDGGETEEGAPYIIMEHVDGLPLMEWVARHGPDRDGRMALFEQVCRAVAAAHRNLIVHRDITPSNILVASDGLVKLIDFGIARPTEAAVHLTETPSPGSISGLSLTPGYAAPERMTGAEVTTAADIYSLGKVLDRLMAPHRGVELDAIIACATDVDPAERYATVEALWEDCRRWAEGRPVRAMRGGRRYALAKFLGRNLVAASAAAAMLALLVTALAATSWSYVRAERARADAERRFEQTRSIARALMTDVFDEVSKVPGSTSARAVLARTGLSYLDALASDPTAPVDVRAEAGKGYVRLAQVTGSGQQGQLGRFEDANALLGEAERILAPLHAEHPGRIEVSRAYAALLLEQSGVNLYNNNEPAKARDQARRVQQLLAPTARTDKSDARMYATAVQAEGDSHGWDNDYAKARVEHQRAERFIAALPPELQADRGVMSARSANLRLLAEAHHHFKDEERALATVGQAVALNERLHAAAPDDPIALRKLAISLWYQTVVLRTNRRDNEAQLSIGRAVALARAWRERAPDDTGALQLFATVGEVDAQVLADRRRFEESYARVADVIAAHRRMVALAGNTPGALRSMAQAMRTGGANHHEGKDYAGACRLWGEALGIFEGLQARKTLTTFDAEGAFPEMRDIMQRGCRGGPPRAVPGLET